MMRVTELAHQLMRQTLQPGDRVVDATLGNGHDTFFMAELVGPSGHVIGFDVQQAALVEARRRVAGLSQVTLIHAGHEMLGAYLEAHSNVDLAGVMFNLGYLPGGDKSIVTRADTTLAALEQAISFLAIHGLITLLLYPGHPGGAEESEAVRSYAQNLSQDFSVNHYARLNALTPPPELLVIERLK